jgi:hypothetical protein
MSNTYWVHINPKNNKNKNITYYPVVVYTEIGTPPEYVFVSKNRIKKAKNQYDLLLDNLEYALSMIKRNPQDFKECYKLVFVSNNDAFVSWFKKSGCPLRYNDQFKRIISQMKDLEVGSLGITSDTSCFAQKYANDCYVTDNFLEEINEEEYVNVIDIFKGDE